MHCSWRRGQDEHGSSIVSWTTEKAILLDAGSPFDSGGHLGSGRAFLRPWLPGFRQILQVGRVGTSILPGSGITSGRERFLMRKESIGHQTSLHIFLLGHKTARPHSAPLNGCCQCGWTLLSTCCWNCECSQLGCLRIRCSPPSSLQVAV